MSKYTIEEVLPHKPPMILLHELEEYDDDSCLCSVAISESSHFYDEVKAGVPTYIGCEYMAQAIAAFAGAHALNKGEEVKVGFLLGSRKYKTHQPYFNKGQKVFIGVKELYQEESGLSVFNCIIKTLNGEVLVEANINVFQPERTQAYINGSNEL